ncbi:hypothetical protein [uncultured Muribaculum sp.]|uniref:hypothetical protein n=1 Tax=uncultured Muribaculum sp. TaxID=1918613 RepID=UPI0025A65F9B|nr:hypothetical protein [uncultured Muribaculum sp.]
MITSLTPFATTTVRSSDIYLYVFGKPTGLKPRQSGARCGRMKRITPHYLALPPLLPEYLIIRAICHVREPGGTPTSHIAFRV